MELIIKVSDCRDCPYRISSSGKDDNWEECCHPNHGQSPFMNILWEGGGFKSVPDWCPIKQSACCEGGPQWGHAYGCKNTM